MRIASVVLYSVGAVVTLATASAPFTYPYVKEWFGKLVTTEEKNPSLGSSSSSTTNSKPFESVCVATTTTEGTTIWKNGDIDCSLYDFWGHSIP